MDWAFKAVAEEGLPAKALCFHKGMWRFKSAQAQSIKHDIVSGFWTRSGEQLALHRLYVCFSFESPRKYMDRLTAAFSERDRCLALIKCNFIVENMDGNYVDDLPL